MGNIAAAYILRFAAANLVQLQASGNENDLLSRNMIFITVPWLKIHIIVYLN